MCWARHGVFPTSAAFRTRRCRALAHLMRLVVVAVYVVAAHHDHHHQWASRNHQQDQQRRHLHSRDGETCDQHGQRERVPRKIPSNHRIPFPRTPSTLRSHTRSGGWDEVAARGSEGPPSVRRRSLPCGISTQGRRAFHVRRCPPISRPHGTRPSTAGRQSQRLQPFRVRQAPAREWRAAAHVSSLLRDTRGG